MHSTMESAILGLSIGLANSFEETAFLCEAHQGDEEKTRMKIQDELTCTKKVTL